MAALSRRDEVLIEIPLGLSSRSAARGARQVACRLARHWLALANGANSLVLGIALLVPVLAFRDMMGLAAPLFDLYRVVCHQLPYRSFFLFGQQMPFCQRDAAIYGSMAIAGLAFVVLRDRLEPLPWRWYLAMSLPIALDGTTQLLGFRESTAELRVLTGALFGIATVWLAYPHIEGFFLDVLEDWDRDGSARTQHSALSTEHFVARHRDD